MADSQVHIIGNITSAVLCCTQIRFLDSSIKDKTSIPSLSFFLRESPDVHHIDMSRNTPLLETECQNVSSSSKLA